nr:E3 SUMO-protein ligase ZBED1-like [Nothobranchius furzeri]
MERKNGLLNGKFPFKTLPDGTTDKTKVICVYCRCELSYHRSTSSLKYHLLAKHTADAESPPPHRKQTTLESFQQRRLDNSTSCKLSTAIAKWVATACRLINIVEDEGLLDVIRIASSDSTYELPSRVTTVTNIQKLYQDEKAKVEETLSQTKTVALTGDYWTSLSNHSYLGVTAHYFTSNWELRSHALTVMKTEDRHFADTCAEHFMQVAQQWNIEVSTLTTDSARNMIAAARQLPFEHMPCITHSLHRAIAVSLQNSPFDSALTKCRKVVGHFKHSPANAVELEQQQIAHSIKKESLNVSTRWNSTLEMIKRVLRNQEPLRAALAQQATTITMPTSAELEKLKKLETVLEHCRYITDLLEGEKFVSCSVVLPALCHLLRVLEVFEEDPAYMVNFKETLKTEIEKRKDKANITWLKVATALDPRFKDLKCLSKPERVEVWRLITALLRERQAPAQPEDSATSEPPKKKTVLMLSQYSSSDEEEDCIERSLDRYKAEPTIDTEDCPQKWWSRHEGAHSVMASLAQKYLATPATSIRCERLFSLSGHVVQKKRAALSSENVKMLVCLSNWLIMAKKTPADICSQMLVNQGHTSVVPEPKCEFLSP